MGGFSIKQVGSGRGGGGCCIYLDRVAECYAKAGAVGSGARDCIQRDLGGIMDGTWQYGITLCDVQTILQAGV